MTKGSGGGGKSGRTGGGGDAIPASSMSDDQIVSGVRTLSTEIQKTQDVIYSDAARKLPIDQRMAMRNLVETLGNKKAELLREADKRKSLTGKVKYERGAAVGFK